MKFLYLLWNFFCSNPLICLDFKIVRVGNGFFARPDYPDIGKNHRVLKRAGVGRGTTMIKSCTDNLVCDLTR